MMKAKEVFHHTAFTIGASLAKQAIWHENHCTWITEDIDYSEHESKLIAKSIGHGIYSGIAGIASFLKELYIHTEDEIIKKTLRGAINTLISHFTSSNTFFEYYNGNLGILITILQCAHTINHMEWENFAKEQLDSSWASTIDNNEAEFLLGLAGTVEPLLKLHESLNVPDFEELIRNIGETIIQKAERSKQHWTWRSPINQSPLTGHSHGASGVAYALLHLFEFTKDQIYWDAAMMGFEYEQLHFDETRQNWQDLRRDSSGRMPQNCAVAWCHGAPGIALSRMKAWAISGHPSFHQQAMIALQTTMNTLYESTTGYWKPMNYSLCHGIAGNADILLTGSRVLNHPVFAEAAYHAGHYGIARFRETGIHWPGGLNRPHDNNPLTLPGLFLGLAGTGYFYLRLANPQMQSIL